jgi:hypothetical protein
MMKKWRLGFFLLGERPKITLTLTASSLIDDFIVNLGKKMKQYTKKKQSKPMFIPLAACWPKFGHEI